MQTTTTTTRIGVPAWTLGDRIRKARRAAGLRLKHLAPVLDKSEATISDWENDKHSPSGLEVRTIAQLTGVDAHWLLTGEPTESDAQGATQSPWTDDAPQRNPFLALVA